jgi:hypothetical protein
MTWLQGKIVVAEGRGRGMRRMASRCTCEQGSKYVVKRGERERREKREERREKREERREKREERREKREERREKREEREREKWGQLL